MEVNPTNEALSAIIQKLTHWVLKHVYFALLIDVFKPDTDSVCLSYVDIETRNTDKHDGVAQCMKLVPIIILSCIL